MPTCDKKPKAVWNRCLGATLVEHVVLVALIALPIALVGTSNDSVGRNANRNFINMGCEMGGGSETTHGKDDTNGIEDPNQKCKMPTPATCFLAGTKINLADGSTKPIEAIAVGDEVKAYDLKSKSFKTGRVTDLIHKKADAYLLVNGRIKITPNHPVLSKGKWVPIGRIRIGDSLFDQSGNRERVTSIEKVDAPKTDVYNLSIAKFHNYVAEGVVVHNSLPNGICNGGIKP